MEHSSLSDRLVTYLGKQQEVYSAKSVCLGSLAGVAGESVSHAGERCAVVLERLENSLSGVHGGDGAGKGLGRRAQNRAPAQPARDVHEERAEALDGELAIGYLQGGYESPGRGRKLVSERTLRSWVGVDGWLGSRPSRARDGSAFGDGSVLEPEDALPRANAADAIA